jgi:hypothetical protein
VSVQKPAIVLHYRERASGFFCAARDLELLDDAPTYAPAIGLLSVHGSIALADALLVAAAGERTRGEDHGESARRLRAWCSAKRIPEGGIKHLEWLLDRKTRFSYDDRYIDQGELLSAKVKLDQFFAWAFQNFPDVANLKETDRA